MEARPVLAFFACSLEVVMGITVIGLGPGNGRLLTREAWALLSTAEHVYLRTARHPAVDDLPQSVARHSFDAVYDAADDFAEVYERIVAELLALGAKDDILYAVPGHPLVGESTVTRLLAAAGESGVVVRVVGGLSFIEPVLTAVGVDALDGLQVFDALDLAAYLYPPINASVPLLVGQVYSRFAASELKQSLGAIYPDEHAVLLVHSAGEESELVESIALYEIDRSAAIDHLTSLYVPALPVAATLPALAETVAVLRSPNGCPWDIEQTPQSMRDSFLEEAYEVLAALDRGDSANLREELGDVLYLIVMQAQMAFEAGEFTLSEVLAGIEAKLKRRHPHVWGDWEVNSTAEVLRNWELLKKQEKRTELPASALDGVLETLPALAHSQKMQDRAAGTGFDWPGVAGVYAKMQEEIEEIQSAETIERRAEELGDLLFATVNLARWLAVDAESALRGASLRFATRFRLVEQMAKERDLDLSVMPLAGLDALWNEAKETLAKAEQDD
jgi:tetrapyrrole methylase family protein/MazG family protein